ncbi:hypothetical protein NQZ79_g5826 [Umbelopsis isabellina]|nr:hypothetical protein NQZ79_g5826 [Umbelopsis isabellina]
MARRKLDDEDDIGEPEEGEERYDDEEDEEEDEDENEDDNPRPSKRRFNPFIDEMAEVDDDDEEEEDDEEYGKEDGFIEEDHDETATGATHSRHLDLDRRRREVEDMDDEQMADFYDKKYGGRNRVQSFKGSAEDVPQQLLLPSVNDPNLWMIKCKPGKERDVIFSLMKRFFDRQYSESPLEIYSVFARESLKGYIYVESRRQAHVQQALLNLPNIYFSTLMLVPIKEMIDSINVSKKQLDIVPGGWARVRRGKYAGDLAQIIDIADSQDVVRVRLVPRLDLEEDRDEYDKKRKKGTYKPPQKLFNPERLNSRALTSSLQKKGGYWYLGSDMFKDGYLEKDMKVTGLTLEDINPTLDEVTKFASGGEEGERGLDLSTLTNSSVTNAAPNHFQIGDTVEVTEGDLLHTYGVVDSVEGGSVTVNLNVEGFHRLVKLPPRQLRKKFSEGDHVKVTNGRFKDETGLIVSIKDNVVTMLSDLSLKEVTVFAKDLREAAEVTLGQTMIGNYELHDLVQLDFYTVGVIVKVDRDSFRVLDQNGEIRTIQPHQITNKRDSKRAVATDANGNSIQAGDTVIEKDGDRRQGTILHLYRQLVFLQSREYVQNFGVWVTRTRSVASVAAKGGRAVNTAVDTTKQQPYGNGSFRGGYNDRGGGRGGRGGGRGGFFGHGRGGRDNLISQTVRIAKGPHKGYMGIVKDTTDNMARVELHTNCRIITVEKSKLVILDARGGTIGPAAEPDNFASPSPSPYNPPPATPKRFGDGGMTPMHYSSGSRTPAWNSGARTPNPYSMDGSKTPAWNAGARTPNPYAMEAPRTPAGAKTPAWDSGSKTPRRSTGAGAGGDDDHWTATPRTPAADTGRAWGKDEDWPTPSTWRSNNDRNKVSTPGPNSAPTPYEAAPTPGGNAIPMTPAALTAPTPAAHMMSAPTPGNYLPTTPAAGQMPQTPFMPTGGDYNQTEEAHTTGDEWPIADIEVTFVKDKGTGNEYEGGAHSGQKASIVFVDRAKRTCKVRPVSGGNDMQVGWDYLEIVKPGKKDNVKIVSGEHRGQIGHLIGVDGHDGIVKLRGGSGFKIMGMTSVAKYTGSEAVA